MPIANPFCTYASLFRHLTVILGTILFPIFSRDTPRVLHHPKSKARRTSGIESLLADGRSSALASICLLGLGLVDTLGEDGGVLVL